MKSETKNREPLTAEHGLRKQLLRPFRFSLREFLLLIVIVSFGLIWFTKEEVWHPEVLRLFSLEERDEALQKILDEAKYVPNPRPSRNLNGPRNKIVGSAQQDRQNRDSCSIVMVITKKRSAGCLSRIERVIKGYQIDSS